jgi:subtilisin family serine protease
MTLIEFGGGRTATAARAVASAMLLVPLAYGSAAAQDRLDPLLREAVTSAANVEPSSLPRPSDMVRAGEERLPPGALALESAPDGSVRIGIFVRLSSPAGVDAIRTAGGVVGSVIGDIATATVPLASLETLAASPGIAWMEAARAVRGEHDVSMLAISAEDVRTRTGSTWNGATGAGTLVAIYDGGLDLMHHDFRDEAGRSRVVSVWDQTTPGSPPPGFSSGTACDSAAVALRVENSIPSACPVQDFTGHGTHVAGSAAGDGSATGNGQPAFRYPGVAPEAKLIIVKGGNGSFFENLIADGLLWIRGEAQRLGRPVVVNLSLGGQFGAHDGSRLYEQVIDQLSGPGFIVVVSSGNQGGNANTTPLLPVRRLHARGFANGTATSTVTMTLAEHAPNANLCTGNVTQIGFWYDASDRLRLELVRPNGQSLTVSSGSSQQQDNAGGRIVIDNASAGVDPRNGDRSAIIRVDGCGTSGAPMPGTWTLRVTPEIAGSGLPWDLWIETSSHGLVIPPVQMRGGDGFDNRYVVASPGNAARAITVGAFVTRVCWPTVAGNSCYVQQEELGDLARFSSGGPRRDGVQKPELTAPGMGIMSARSGSSGVISSRQEPDGVHSLLEGTSMAAPHVTGTIAVLLQANPGLTPEAVRTALTTSARQDAFTTRTYDAAGAPADWWGAGKLNVRDALQVVSGGGAAVLALQTESAVPPAAVRVPRGTRLPLLALELRSQGTEAIDVSQLGFRVSGNDPGAYLVLVRDVNRNGELDAGDMAVDSVPAGLDGSAQVIRSTIDPPIRVGAFDSQTLIVALSMSGAAPNGATFAASFLPDSTRSRGVTSGVQDSVEVAAGSLDSGPARTTVLAVDELLSFSANPVCGERVVFNFAAPPTTAAVYTVTGRRVIDLRADGALRAEWDLRNEEGSRIAPGVYLVVFSVEGELFREKLMVLRGTAAQATCSGDLP